MDAKKVPPLLLVRAGWDAFVRDAKARGAPLTLVELPEAHHAFDLVDEPGLQSPAGLA